MGLISGIIKDGVANLLNVLRMWRLGEMSDGGERGASVPGGAGARRQRRTGGSHIAVRANPQRPKVRAVPKGRKRLEVGTKPAYLTRIYASFQLDRLIPPIINYTWPTLSHTNAALPFAIRFNFHESESVNLLWSHLNHFCDSVVHYNLIFVWWSWIQSSSSLSERCEVKKKSLRGV